MEAAGRDDSWWPASWSYRHHRGMAGSSSYTSSTSSRSGTIVSPANTSSRSASRHSSWSSVSMESGFLHWDLDLRMGMSWIEVEVDKNDAEFVKIKEMKMRHIGSLVQEFFQGPSQNRSIFGRGGGGGGGCMGALEKWFSELGVSWVLQLDAECPRHGNTDSWIKALRKIMFTIQFTESFFADHGHGFVGMPAIIISEEEVESGKRISLDPVQFAWFFYETMSKMLDYLDVMFSESPSIHGPLYNVYISDCLIPYLNVHSALSKTLSGIRLQLHSSPPAEVEEINKEMVSLLSAKQDKAIEFIWSMLQKIRTHLLKSIKEYSLGTQTPQESSDIHKATYLVMNHINNFGYIESAFDLLVSQAARLKNVPQTGLNSLIMEMVSCLQEKLITPSELFLDKGLMFLFLLNNLNFIQERLECYSNIKLDMATITSKVEHSIESYIQVSWAPMLSCLFDHTPLCLGRNYSPLSKFESEFQKIYATQNLWKVPDPELRKRLRKAVIEKIIPGYTRYIEESKVTNPKFTPQELEEMLQELFEG